MLLLRLQLGLLGRHWLLRLLTRLLARLTWVTRLRLRLRLRRLRLLRLRARLLGLRQLLRGWVRSGLRLRSDRLLRGRLGGRRLRRIGLRRAAALVRWRAGLGLGSDALRIVHGLGLSRCALLRCLLSRLSRRIGLLGLLRLMRVLLSLLGLLRLLHRKDVLLRNVLRLSVRHLLELHLQVYRSHPGIGLHGGDLSGIDALGAVW